MNVELNNPFIEMLKRQINELEEGKISQELYISKARDTIKYLERWIEEISKLALTKMLYNVTAPIKVEPGNTNFDMQNRQKRREAVEKLNDPSKT